MVPVPEVKAVDLAFGKIDHLPDMKKIPEEFKEQIKQKTKGWPLFLEEIVVFLSQAGFINISQNNVVLRPEVKDLVLPDAIEELIAVRLDHLFS